jgi:hypothetical protein
MIRWGTAVWRHVLYAVCLMEAAVLAAVLVVVVIEPDLLGLVPSPGVRQLCGWAALVLMVGCAYGVVGWLRSLVPGARVRQSLISAAMAGRPGHPNAGRGRRDDRGRPALDHGAPQAGCQTAAASWWPGSAWRPPGRMRHAFHHRRLRVRALVVAVPAIVVASACGSLRSVPNPFAASATPRPTIAAVSQVTPTPRPPSLLAPSPVPFEPFWVQNHRIAELWSGPSSQPDTVSFGATSGQFCSFPVVLPPDGERLYVFNPYSQNYLWIDAADVGPAGSPDERQDPRPTDVNCAREMHRG